MSNVLFETLFIKVIFNNVITLIAFWIMYMLITWIIFSSYRLVQIELFKIIVVNIFVL